MIETTAAFPEGSLASKTRGPGGFVRYDLFAVILTVLGYSLGYSTIGFGLLFFGALWSLLRYRHVPWLRTSLDVPLMVFGLALVASAAASPFRDVAVPVTLMLLISGGVYFGAFASLLQAVPDVRGPLFRAWAIGAVAAAAVGIYYSLVPHEAAAAPVRAAIPRGVGPNGLGTTLMLGGIVSLGLVRSASRRERWAWIAAGLVCLVGLLASGSRASLAGWVVGAAYLVWRDLRARPGQMLAAVVVGLSLLVGIAALTPQFAGRVTHTVHDVSGNRLRIWPASLAMVAAHPLLGTGFGTFQRAYDERRDPGMSPEPFAFNLWLNLAVETGLIGLGTALWVGIEAVRAQRRWRERLAVAGVREADPWQAIIAALWAGLLVDQFADNTLFSISTSAALWLLLALVVVHLPPDGRAAPARAADRQIAAAGRR